jgi:hypothetical protein
MVGPGKIPYPGPEAQGRKKDADGIYFQFFDPGKRRFL